MLGKVPLVGSLVHEAVCHEDDVRTIAEAQRAQRDIGDRNIKVLNWLFAGSALLLLAACSDDSPSVLRPRSEAAERVEGLWWLTFWTSVFVCVLVAAFIVSRVPSTGAPYGLSAKTRP